MDSLDLDPSILHLITRIQKLKFPQSKNKQPFKNASFQIIIIFLKYTKEQYN